MTVNFKKPRQSRPKIGAGVNIEYVQIYVINLLSKFYDSLLLRYYLFLFIHIHENIKLITQIIITIVNSCMIYLYTLRVKLS